MPDATGRRYAVLVPVKRSAVAKSRLAQLGDDARADLAVAFAVDTVDAALGCPSVARVLAVTDDHVLAGGLRELGADVLPDGTSQDLNGTLVQAAAEMRRRDAGLEIVALCADLPALRSTELEAALRASAPDRMSFVSDVEGVGTTMVVAPDLARFRPHFGAGSRALHLAEGAHEIDVPDLPTLRRDVDDPLNLAQALELGVGPRTSLVAALLGLSRTDPRRPLG
jgi:2-phospho-L-lactate guanylyltransferase